MDYQVKKTQPINYFVQFKPSGWASFTLNESTGELNIQSDWGNFSHYWNSRSEGVSLEEFIIEASIPYLVMKFGYNNSDLKEEVDDKATQESYKKAIEEKATEKGERVKPYLLELDEWEENSFDKQVCPEEILELFDYNYEELNSLYVYRQSYTNKILSELLLPVLKEHLKSQE